MLGIDNPLKYSASSETSQTIFKCKHWSTKNGGQPQPCLLILSVHCPLIIVLFLLGYFTIMLQLIRLVWVIGCMPKTKTEFSGGSFPPIFNLFCLETCPNKFSKLQENPLLQVLVGGYWSMRHTCTEVINSNFFLLSLSTSYFSPRKGYRRISCSPK